MPGLYSLLGVSTPFDPTNRFTTSIILPTIVLAIIRLLLSLYAFITIFYILGWYPTHGRNAEARHWFSYFTSLTYFGIAFYMLFAGLHSLSYALRGKSWLNNWPRPLQAAHSVLYTTIIVFPPLVTIVFWVILYDGPWYPIKREAWSNVSQHGLNSLYALFEIILPRTSPPPPLQLAILIFILALYLSLAYLTHATEGFYVYSFLDPAKGSGRVAAYAFGILAAVIVIFGLVWCIIWVRGWSARRVGIDYDRRRGRRSTSAVMEEQDMDNYPQEVK